MTTNPGSESRRPLWTVLLLLVLGAVVLWAASSVSWAEQRFATPFSGAVTSSVDGATVRPELTPVALAALAAGAAVLATGGWLRRLVGLLVVLGGGMLLWRSADLQLGPLDGAGNVPPGSDPLGELAVNPVGPLLMGSGGLALVAAGLVVAFRAHRMPGMGAKYAAPGAAKRQIRDPDRQLWDALDADHDPTEEDHRP